MKKKDQYKISRASINYNNKESTNIAPRQKNRKDKEKSFYPSAKGTGRYLVNKITKF
jgi:hypothetical protein